MPGAEVDRVAVRVSAGSLTGSITGSPVRSTFKPVDDSITCVALRSTTIPSVEMHNTGTNV